MSMDLPNTSRLLIEVKLAPLQGTRFQPTGFPDVGAATYKLPDGTQMLVVESAQSIANRLESVCWDEVENKLVPSLAGLSYVDVQDAEGKWLTSSVLEAHRLNSAYIENSDGAEAIESAIGFEDGKPFDRRKLAGAICKYDAGALLHGVFLESIAGVLRLPRALSGFIEAHHVEVVAAGGVKNDRVKAGTEEGGAGAKEGYGNVPFHRDEYVAGGMTAYFNLDLDQLRSYGLGPDVERMLFAFALFKIQRFLDRGLRLRTACDLVAREVMVTRPLDFKLPALADLEREMPKLIVAAASKMASPAVTTVKHLGAKKREPKAKKARG